MKPKFTRLIGHDALRDRVADGHAEGLALGRQLRRLAEEGQPQVRHLGEPRVLLVLRVHEVLNLRLGELSHAQQPRAGRDLVAERLPDLRAREGQLAPVVVQQVPEVDEDALRGFGAHEALEQARRPNLGRKHQIKFEHRRQPVLRLGRLFKQRE